MFMQSAYFHVLRTGMGGEELHQESASVHPSVQLQAILLQDWDVQRHTFGVAVYCPHLYKTL